MASVLVRYPKTASNRARLLGQLDRLGRGNEALSETDDELIAVVMDYAGDEHAAAEHFDGASEIAHNDFTGKVPQAGASEDWEPIVAVGGEIIARPASSREGPPAPPETDAGGGTAPDRGGAPDTADTPSPHLSGAAQAQATADKRKAAKK
jgi:hypothetical protein